MNMTPLNLQEEKKKFFFDPLYNPQFHYEEPITDDILYGRYGAFGGELIGKTKDILDTVIKKWGSESKYLEEVEGRLLTREESTVIIQNYLAECGLQQKVTVHFSTKFIARTRVEGYKMYVRLPIEYREKSIRGMLHHEIGTHVFRRINDERQVWHNRRNEFKLSSYLETEEGIALLHSHIDSEHAYFWRSAVQYYACFLASTQSFSKVYEGLKPYVDDRESRFYYVVRSKRGLVDTSKPGGYTKDQVYLRGFYKISSWLKKHNYDVARFYIGKIAIEDLEKVSPIADNNARILPFFMSQDPEKYLEKIKEVIKVNTGEDKK